VERAVPNALTGNGYFIATIQHGSAVAQTIHLSCLIASAKFQNV
jgi:hypothetical protein